MPPTPSPTSALPHINDEVLEYIERIQSASTPSAAGSSRTAPRST